MWCPPSTRSKRLPRIAAATRSPIATGITSSRAPCTTTVGTLNDGAFARLSNRSPMSSRIGSSGATRDATSGIDVYGATSTTLPPRPRRAISTAIPVPSDTPQRTISVGPYPARGEIIEDRLRVGVQPVLARRSRAIRPAIPPVLDERDGEPLRSDPLGHPDVVADHLPVAVEVDDHHRRIRDRELHRVHEHTVGGAELEKTRPPGGRRVVDVPRGVEDHAVAQVPQGARRAVQPREAAGDEARGAPKPGLCRGDHAREGGA